MPHPQREEWTFLDNTVGCVLWGSCVVIPLILRPTVVQLPHEGHPGTSWMKASARGVVWWSGMDV